MSSKVKFIILSGVDV